MGPDYLTIKMQLRFSNKGLHTIAVFMYPVEVKLALTTTSANANSGCTKDPLLAT